ncbi:hypothetical protein DRO97_07420 [Archaeoglobales archaeon]|nr:MAG: hypothetical protein DRO97_07420 [Archaeoglobales archaeon]
MNKDDWREQDDLKILKQYIDEDETEKAFELFIDLSNKTKMIKLMEELIGIGEYILEKVEGEERGRVLGTLGNLYFNVGKLEDAEKYYLKALEFYIQLAKKDESNMKYVAGALNNLGNLYHVMNKPSEAEKAFKDALTIREDVGDANELATTLSCLGLLYSNIAEFEKAKEYYEKALVTKLNALNKENYLQNLNDLGTILNNLGTVYNALKEIDKAEESYKKAIEVYEELLKHDERVEDLLCGALNNLASLYIDCGELDRAQRLIDRIKKYESFLPPDLRVRVTLNNAKILESKDMKKAAEEYLRAGSMAFILFRNYGMNTINFIYCFEKVEKIGEGKIKGDANIMKRAMLKTYFGIEKDKEIKEVECSKRGRAILDALKGNFKLEVKNDIDLAAYIIASEVKKKSGF